MPSHVGGKYDRHGDSFLGKSSHTSQTLGTVTEFVRRIFFVSNTQDNLADEVQAVAPIPYKFTDEAIDRLASAAGRHALRTQANRERLFLMDVFPGIRGSDSDWAAVFRGMLERALPILPR